MAFTTHDKNGLVYLTAACLSGIPHGFSTRLGGVSPAPWDSLNLRRDQGDGPEALMENYRRLLGALEMDLNQSVMSYQVHGAAVRVCTREDAGKGLFRERGFVADGLVTDVPGMPLMVFSADCGTILLHDPVTGAVGAVHAGWRGCAAGIPAQAVETMVRAYGTNPADVRAALGPCIQSCCFETDADVPAAMEAALGAKARSYFQRRGPKWHVDLSGLNIQWLLDAGVLPRHIENSGLCSACHPELFWSHRKMGERRGVQGAVIARPAPQEGCV